MIARKILGWWVVCLVLGGSLLSGCARAPLKDRTGALRASEAPALADDLPLPPLLDAIDAQIAYWQKKPTTSPTSLPAPDAEILVFGPRAITRVEYIEALRQFVAIGRAAKDPAEFFRQVRENFAFMEVYGRDDWGEVFMTSYYEPLVKASRTPTQDLYQPVYKTPADLVTLDLGAFDAKYADGRKLRGRLLGRALVPYYTREEIDSLQLLKGRGLEICYLDPIEAFFLQVQGSGTAEFGDGKRLRLIYAEKNGHRYESLGRMIRDRIPGEVTLQSIETYLRSIPRSEMQRALNLNPSYVFFQPSEQGAVTYLGVSATAGRTIATDPKYFPKGGLGFLIGTKPRFANAEATEPVAWEPFARFVLDQDIGGAITGGGRLDLFWGTGPTAKQAAGVMKNPGKLYYVVPRPK